jgi:Big-like domain-containing protein
VPRSMVGGLWMVDANFKSTIYLKNDIKVAPITVTPILYLSNGRSYRLSDVNLEPSGTAVVSINQALSEKGIAPWATLTGYLEVQYTWPWDPLCVTIWNVDVVHSLIFSYSLQPAVLPNAHQDASARQSTRLEGLWWKQEPGVTGFVALSNPFAESIRANIEVSDNQAKVLALHTVTVSPHGTKLVDLRELQSGPSSEGGVWVTWEGAEDRLLVYGGLQDPATGYSARLLFHFLPLASAKPGLVTDASVGLMTGEADPMMLFPAGTRFTPYSILRNATDRSLSVQPMVYWMEGSRSRSASLPPLTILPYHTVNLNLGSLLSGAGLGDFNGNVNVTFEHQGKPRELLIASGSVDQKNTYVFEVYAQAVVESVAKTLSYWSTANGDDTMVSLWNPADEAQDFVFTLFFSGGHYKFPVHLEPRATHTFNISEIIQNQVPDEEGSVIPASVHEGSAEVAGPKGENQHILVAMDAGTYNVRKATCGIYCLTCQGATLASVGLNPFAVAVGGKTQLSFTVTYHDGTKYDYTKTATWSSSDNSIGTVSAGLVTGVSAGSLTASALDASTPDYSSACWGSNPDATCPQATGVNGGGNGNVLQVSQSPVSLNMSNGDTDKSIQVTISGGSGDLAFSVGGSQNPNSSSHATVSIPGKNGASGTASYSISVSGTNSPSGIFGAVACATGVCSAQGTTINIPPQVLIQMMQAEAGGANSTAMMADGDVARNRMGSSLFNPPYSTYQNTIVSGQFAIGSATTGIEPELDSAVSVFTSAGGNFCNSLAFWTPTSSQWTTVQNAINSKTTAFPSGTGAPTYSAWPSSQQQILYVSSVGTQGSGAPNFLYLAQRSSSQAAAVTASCTP